MHAVKIVSRCKLGVSQGVGSADGVDKHLVVAVRRSENLGI